MNGQHNCTKIILLVSTICFLVEMADNIAGSGQIRFHWVTICRYVCRWCGNLTEYPLTY